VGVFSLSKLRFIVQLATNMFAIVSTICLRMNSFFLSAHVCITLYVIFFPWIFVTFTQRGFSLWIFCTRVFFLIPTNNRVLCCLVVIPFSQKRGKFFEYFCLVAGSYCCDVMVGFFEGGLFNIYDDISLGMKRLMCVYSLSVRVHIFNLFSLKTLCCATGIMFQTHMCDIKL